MALGLLFAEPARLATWEWCEILFLFMSPAGCPVGLCFHPLQRLPAGVPLAVGGHSLEVPGDWEKWPCHSRGGGGGGVLANYHFNL